jgi:cell division initiation protein
MAEDKLVSRVLGPDQILTPSEISNAIFRIALVGGYKKREVEIYLDSVADTIETLIAENRSLKEELETHRKMETSLRAALFSTQKLSENVLDSAKREADALVKEARVKAERILLEAERERANAIDNLQSEEEPPQ